MPNTEGWTTGDWLNRYLFDHKITKKWLLDQTGMTDETLNRILRNDRVGNIGTWMRIGDVLECCVSELLEPVKLIERFSFLEEPQQFQQPRKEMMIDDMPISEWLKS